ncbi:MAG: hypothetical protein FJ121_04380 [Deltaproteobacteria bacterium]|nr:hypothetical protein [Deltaproteobacteria bacterium]
MMIVSRGAYVICLLLLALALVGPGWAQTATPPAPEPAKLYGRAVSLLEQAQQQLTAGNLSAALTLVKQSNELFTLLQKECASALAERQLSPKDDQQVAINQKLAVDAQAQADRLLPAAAAKKKQALDLQAQGQAEAGDAALRESREGYLQVQNLSIKSAIYALRNQQIIFGFLAP